MLLIDEFACNLRDGKADLPMNDRSRELLRENEYLKQRNAELEGRAYGTGFIGGRTGAANEDLLTEIRKENKELKDLLLKLHASGQGPAPAQTDEVNVLQLPPMPIADRFTGKISEGYSFRFGTNMPTAEIYTGDTEKDLSALQLQIIETLELFMRKDDDDKLTDMELDEFRSKLRSILAVID